MLYSSSLLVIEAEIQWSGDSQWVQGGFTDPSSAGTVTNASLGHTPTAYVQSCVPL